MLYYPLKVRGSVRAVLLQLFLTVGLIVSGMAAQAHVFKSSEAILYFDRGKELIGMNLQLNLEAILAGIDPDLKDTNDSPNAPEYNRLRALPPAELQKEWEAFKPELLAGLNIQLDGKRIEPTFTEAVFKEVGDLTLARSTDLKFNAKLPPDAKVFTFNWLEKFGRVTLRTISVRAKSAHIETIEPGQTSTQLVIDDIKARTQLDMIRDFMVIGYVHIVPKGTDHILFVLGIFLLSTRWRPILAQVTAFTVAHTLTLGLGTLGYVNLPSSIVEPLIAASIVYVAVENILRPTLSPWRPLVVFMFGLLHGLGFAGILREFGMPEGEFVPGLLSFNVGVELGQLSIIAVAYLLVGIWFGRKPWYRQRVVIPGSLIIAAIGGFWFIQRVFFP